ncbi:MAG TPA: glycosyltransferase family 2 protein [Burkholderiaceae bacterium]|nr:glycosyltransferase family 2 protein [Burkholderiaceae bacterium]
MKTAKDDQPRVWVVVVNWNGCSDTIECLESLLKYGGPLLSGVVVCDNQSSDGSVVRIAEWLGSRGVRSREFAFDGSAFTRVGSETFDRADECGSQVIIINTGGNLGFAGGNNVGIRYVRGSRGYEYIFFLNNDAAIGPGCIDAAVSRFAENQELGMVGCTILNKEPPEAVQAFGGASFQPWLARGSVIGAGAPIDRSVNRSLVESKLDYIHGAALMINRECLEKVGPMEEDYFLYYEEIDWAIRAKRAGYSLGYAQSALVFHKGGATIGSSSDDSKRSLLSEYYLVRNAVRFTKKFYPHRSFTVLPFLWLKTLEAWLGGDSLRAKVRVRAIMGKPRCHEPISATQ